MNFILDKREWTRIWILKLTIKVLNKKYMIIIYDYYESFNHEYLYKKNQRKYILNRSTGTFMI